MSTGFGGATTKTYSDVTHEVETRLAKLKGLDRFTDDFSPPGTAEFTPGQDPDKDSGGYGKPQDNTSSATSTSTIPSNLESSPFKQELLDEIDEGEQRATATIKPVEEQFPGSQMKKPLRIPASDNAGFDVHSTDPARLSLSDLIEMRLNKLRGGK